jgi:hypothetical protein
VTSANEAPDRRDLGLETEVGWVVLALSSVVSTATTTTTEDDMTLYDYDSGLVQQHIDDLRRDADKARLVRGARRRRQRSRQSASAQRAARPVAAR